MREVGIPDDGMMKVVLRRSGEPVIDSFISRTKTTINRSYTNIGKK